MSERTPSVDDAVDLLLYAPIGFALEVRSLLPKFVERGRNQVTMAKMVGRFAVQQGQTEANRRLEPFQDQVAVVLADLGLVTRPTAPSSADDGAAGPEAAPETPSTSAPASSATEAPASSPTPVTEDEPVAVVDVASLAIPDYDSLAASQVVPRLRALESDELEAVRSYEVAGRGRKTILNRIAQLQAG